MNHCSGLTAGNQAAVFPIAPIHKPFLDHCQARGFSRARQRLARLQAAGGLDDASARALLHVASRPGATPRAPLSPRDTTPSRLTMTAHERNARNASRTCASTEWSRHAYAGPPRADASSPSMCW